MGFAPQIDKKIVRTEIGVLLRLSHPNIVSRTLVTRLPPPFGWGPGLLGLGLPSAQPGAEGRAGMSLSSSHFSSTHGKLFLSPVSPPCLTDSLQVTPHSLPHEIPGPCCSFELPALIPKPPVLPLPTAWLEISAG